MRNNSISGTATESPSPTCQIRAPISYDGKPDYLPSALLPAKEASQAVVRYSYDAQYGLDQLPAPIAIVNPWMLAGFPSGSNAVVVTARLDVVREGAAVRSYAAAAALKRTATIFSEGETLTAMRHRALLLVRDSISAQICRDEAIVTQLLSEK